MEPTIGVEYATKNMLLKDGSGIVKVQIWDTAGSEKYHSITTAYKIRNNHFKDIIVNQLVLSYSMI